MKIEEYLEELKEIESKATPGPWKHDLGNWQIECMADKFYRMPIVECDIDDARVDSCEEFGYPLPPSIMDDGAFIAKSRTAIPRLIKIIDELTMTLDNIKMAAKGGDETTSELECHHLAEDALDLDVEELE